MNIGSISFKAKLEVIIDDFDILIGLDILRLFRGSIDLQYNRFAVKKELENLKKFQTHHH